MAWLHNNVILPLCEPERHRGLGRRLKQLERFDAMSKDEQLAEQETRVRKLLDHAYKTTPYYRRMFDIAGFRAADWKSGQPIPLPELTRDLLRANAHDLRSRTLLPENLRRATTGGTTSTPVAIWRDVEGLRDKTALQFHLNRWSGYDQGTSVLHIWGAERDLVANPSWKWKLYEQGLLRKQTGAAGQLNEQVMQSFLHKLNRHRPRILYGYSATTARFAEFLKASGVVYHKPERLIVTAEPLSGEDRKILETVFECPVTEHYGSRDIGMVAAQCDQGGRLHFHPAACYLELVHAGATPEGPLYRLIATDLLNYGMPLIRYDTADCVQLDSSPCPCGSWFPSVTKILGRALDNFILPDGSMIPGIAITVIMARSSRGFQNIRQLQLIQKSVSNFQIRYSANGEVMAIQQELATFRMQVEELFGITLQWSAERVPEILRERSGKLRLCISEVTQAREKAV